MGKLRSVIELATEISIWKFFKYNLFTKGVKRKKGVYIIPYKNAVLDIGKNAELIIEKTFTFGANKLKGSKTETHVRIHKNGKWIARGECYLFFGVFIDIHENALFESGFFSANTGTVIVVGKHVKFGENVMIGREVTIYDSDFHQILNEADEPVNFSRDVIIGDNVWLTNKIAVLKGVTIGEGALISAMTLIRKDVPPYALVAGNPGKVIKENVKWKRDSIVKYEQSLNK